MYNTRVCVGSFAVRVQGQGDQEEESDARGLRRRAEGHAEEEEGG